jgi:hypothetical protein
MCDPDPAHKRIKTLHLDRIHIVSISRLGFQR